jgi:co-chaperonin GroES (HSP10)
MTLQATGTRYVIRPIELTMASAGGIILKSTEDTQLAEVVSVGPKVEEPLPLGTKIVVNWNHTVPVKHENEALWIIESGAVAAVYEGAQ